MFKDKIQQDLRIALREKKEVEVSTLRMLLSAILNKEKEKRYKLSQEKPDLEDLDKEGQLTDEEVLDVISSEVKKRKEAILGFEKGERKDLVEKEKKELDLLQEYLPDQLSKEEIESLAKEAVEKVKAEGMKDMGRVMSELMPKVKGKADGGLVSSVVKELLTQ